MKRSKQVSEEATCQGGHKPDAKLAKMPALDRRNGIYRLAQLICSNGSIADEALTGRRKTDARPGALEERNSYPILK
jgi:hypothetical protein